MLTNQLWKKKKRQLRPFVFVKNIQRRLSFVSLHWVAQKPACYHNRFLLSFIRVVKMLTLTLSVPKLCLRVHRCFSSVLCFHHWNVFFRCFQHFEIKHFQDILSSTTRGTVFFACSCLGLF